MKFDETAQFLTNTLKISCFLSFSNKAGIFPGSGWAADEKILGAFLADGAVENKIPPVLRPNRSGKGPGVVYSSIWNPMRAQKTAAPRRCGGAAMRSGCHVIFFAAPGRRSGGPGSGEYRPGWCSCRPARRPGPGAPSASGRRWKARPG